MQKARSKGGDNTVSAQPSDRAVSLEGSTSNVHMPNCPSSPTLPSPWGGSQRWKEDKNRREGDQILAQQLNVCLPVHSPRRGHGYGAVDGVGKRGRTPWGVRRWPKLADTFYEETLKKIQQHRGGFGGGGAQGWLQGSCCPVCRPNRTHWTARRAHRGHTLQSR